jgi:hypothetical protein
VAEDTQLRHREASQTKEDTKTTNTSEDRKEEILNPIHFYRNLAKIDKILLPWKGKYLSICGKITLINSLVISVYLFAYGFANTCFLNYMNKKYSILFGMASQTKLKGSTYATNMNSEGINY